MTFYLTAARFIPDNRACGKLKAVAGVAHGTLSAGHGFFKE
jgi:hypothetical protein